jgi:mRNA interferase MazF
VVVPLSETAPIREPIVVGVNWNGKTVAAFCDQVRTINKTHLVNAIGTVTLDDMQTLDDSLRQVLSL